jgi:hypothetical protein
VSQQQHVTEARPWRECGYCGATVRTKYCSETCKYHSQTIRDVEVRGVRRKDVTHTSAWEDALWEARLACVRRLVEAGCPIDVAILEAGFTWDERVAVSQRLRRHGLRWPRPERY